jgi:hypothetical protein
VTLTPTDPTQDPPVATQAPLPKTDEAAKTAPAPAPATDDLPQPVDPNPKPATAPASRQSDKSADTAAPAPDAASAGHVAGIVQQAAAQLQAENQPSTTIAPQQRSAPAEVSAPAAPAQTEPSTPTAHTPAVNDIKLQVAGEGDQRVEVRVTERAGDVYVAVRTPDTRLAGDLRQDLPTLATRLEQTGFHATTWSPAADSERQRLADPQAAASGQDPQGQFQQNGRDQQRDPQQQKEQDPENSPESDRRSEPGKDFAWLLSSIR